MEELKIENTFQQLTEHEQEIIIKSHQGAFRKLGLKAPTELMYRLFNLANPKVVIEGKVCRVHSDSKEVAQVIFRQYLY